MSDPSDIEELLAKHFQQMTTKSRLAWVRMAILTVCTTVGALYGAGKVAYGLLSQIATKDSMALLLKGQDEKIKTLQDTQGVEADRLAKTEGAVAHLEISMRDQTRRVDILYAQPMQVRPTR